MIFVSVEIFAAKRREEVDYDSLYVTFEEELMNYVGNFKKKLATPYQWLFDIEPYNYTILYVKDVKRKCEKMLSFVGTIGPNQEMNGKLILFTQELLNFVRGLVSSQETLFCVGD